MYIYVYIFSFLLNYDQITKKALKDFSNLLSTFKIKTIPHIHLLEI
ncbi:unnamed protein product [Phytomonas sp. Hart1]|nr:unnamed protein product [Phytomonas sp. Hart1]|eukprot:CCW68529.1 unnamed protein product [Phytomonas sp. isolate Hart1]